MESAGLGGMVLRRPWIVSAFVAALTVAVWVGYRYVSAYLVGKAQRDLQRQILGGYDHGGGTPLPTYVWIMAAGVVISVCGMSYWLFIRRR